MNGRLISIDVFRGMTIFFMIIVNTLGSYSNAYPFLLHAKWDGLTPTDLVFPFFMFIMGMSMVFSFKKFERANRKDWVTKVLRRTVLIFLIGIFLNWFPFVGKPLSDLRIFGVLQRIALGYGFAGLILIYFKREWIPYIIGFLLLSYWTILLFFGSEDPLSLEGNLVRHLDLLLFGETHLYQGYGIPFDPEGFLSTWPSIATVLLGFIFGEILDKEKNIDQKIKKLLIGGLILLILGLLWNWLGFPINKPIWSSSYVLVTAGLGAILLAFLTYIIDKKHKHRWAFIFKVFGLNPLISYVLSGLVVRSLNMIKIEGRSLYPWLYEHVFSSTFGLNHGSAIQAVVYMSLIWLFAYLLYRNNKVIKI